MKIAQSLLLAASAAQAVMAQGDGFTQETKCDDICPSVEPPQMTPCAPASFEDCNCVYGDKFCAWTCLPETPTGTDGTLVQMCYEGGDTGDKEEDAPAASPVRFTEFTQDTNCNDICPAKEPARETQEACVPATIGDCSCVYDTDIYCSWSCQAGSDTPTWALMCQSRGSGGTNTCDAVCPAEEPSQFSTCDTTAVGTCSCVYSDIYCSWDCMSDGWLQKCQSVWVPDESNSPSAAVVTKSPVKAVVTASPVKAVGTKSTVKESVTNGNTTSDSSALLPLFSASTAALGGILLVLL